MTILLALYVGTGFGLAVTALAGRDFRRCIDRLAARMGMTRGYGRTVWFGGTVFFWPIGLYVLASGRLFPIDAGLPASGVPTTSADRRTTTEAV